jgi:hypothetical protein
VSRIARLVLAIIMAGMACVAEMVPRLVTGSQWFSMSVRVASPLEIPRVDATLVVPSLPEESDGVIDLYGNDVSPAVAEYSVDPLGSPYEVHSPQTELPRLASPKS